MADQDDLQRKLRMGMEAARRGDKAAAQVLLREVVAADPQNELAWLWLASAVESVDERRAHLQKVLSINPNNSRARDALRRLQADSPAAERAPASPARTPRRRPPAAAETERSGPSTSTLIIGAVVGIAVLTALIFALVVSLQPADPTRQELVAALSPTLTLTPDPADFSPTPSPFMVIVSPNVNLPPTFTPTFTPTEPPTAIPSPTPLPLSSFTMIFTGFEAGAQSPSLFRASGDGGAAEALGSDVRDIAFDPSGQKVAFIRDVIVSGGEAPPAPVESEEGEAEPEPAEGEESPAPQTTVYAELFIAPVDNLAAAEQITRFEGTISSPSWAPNGFQLAFVSDFDGDPDIWTITDDGLEFDKVTDNNSIDADPTWSPDGSMIVYVSDQDSPGLTKLYSIEPNGENRRLLLNMAGNTYQPAWSHDGSKLAFVNDANGDGDIFVSDPDGQGSLLITSDDGGAEDQSPAFTPDGAWVGFSSNRDGDRFQLYVTDLLGSVLVKLTDDERDQQEVDFRPELILRLRETS